MDRSFPIINTTMELADCRNAWFFDEKYDCWCLEDILYTEKAELPAYQRLSVFAPKACMNPDGTPTEAGKQVPVVFENNSAGYMQMPHTWLGGPRCYAEQYLRHGLVYITCGCRGRESRNAAGEPVGRSPISLIDLKTALRFLRHNAAALPGNPDRIVSVGWSAGGAMSALLGVTGGNRRYDPWLRENGAFMEESDSVFAAQIYCPIIDLEHADLAYEWCFGADKENEASHAGPAGIMSPFQEALSRKLSQRYIGYVNGLRLRHPQTGAELKLNPDGRSGGFYDYQMACLNEAATKFLREKGDAAADYLAGNYTYQARAPREAAAHHAGQEIELPKEEHPRPLGEMMLRPPKGTPFVEQQPHMITRQGTDKRGWLSWDGKQACISDLDTYVLRHRRRMKGCTSFDTLSCDSAENQVFGSADQDSMHFNPEIGQAIRELAADFPEEAARYGAAFDTEDDAALRERVFLLNPMNFIGTGEASAFARHFRIRVGASDADTSFSVSMTLALRLANAGYPTDYALVWDEPHSEADTPGAILNWIDEITGSI